jgi:outer membrane scaffolding protein for murein synthesis (MipA/OmpV family)
VTIALNSSRRCIALAAVCLGAASVAAAQAPSADDVAAPAASASAPRPRLLPPIEPRLTVRKPLWEIGMGVGGLTLPTYRGSGERSSYLLPVPYIAYRGRFLKADRDGARAVFIDSDRVELNLSAGAAPPVRHTDTGARAGMDDLPGTLELGPNLNLTLWRSNEKGLKLDLRLPVRGAITLERSPHDIGAVFAPNINLDAVRFAGGWDVGMHTGPLFATRRYHGHYYDVAPADVRPGRPAYRAPGGYSGWQATAAVSRRIGNVWYGGFMRYDNLAGAAFEDSPLVRRRSGLTAGLGVSWIFSTSSDTVEVPLER